MATVYLAEDVKHHRRVAIKVLHPELSAILGTERFDGDARHDLWVHSPASRSTIVLDRFNMIHLYGDLERLAMLLRNLGLIEVAAFAAPTVPTPHALHYHPEWDEAERRILVALPWHRSQLRPGDVQWWSGPEAG